MKSLKNNQEEKTPAAMLPFARIAWREGYQLNYQVLQRWAEEFNRAELATVIHKLRDCGMYLIDAAQYQDECLKLNDKGLILVPIQKIKKEDQLYYQCAVSYSEQKAQELTELLQSDKTNCAVRIGGLLGYPSCCVGFLKKYSTGRIILDPLFLAAKRTKGAVFRKGKGPDGKGIAGKVPAEIITANIAPEMNILFRNFGIKTIPHMPCSFGCKKSLELSKMFLKFMPSSNSLLRFLAEPVVWDEYKGIALIDSRWFKGATQSIFHDDKIHHIINLNKSKTNVKIH